MARLIELQPMMEVVEFTTRNGVTIRIQDSHKDFLKQALDSYAPNGRGLKNVRQCIRIVEAIDSATEAVRLEEADYEVLTRSCDEMGNHPKVARATVKYLEAVALAQEVKL